MALPSVGQRIARLIADYLEKWSKPASP